MKQAPEARDVFLLIALTPQQSAEAQAAFARPLRQLIKEHEATTVTFKGPVDAVVVEYETEIASKEGSAVAEAWLR